MQNRDDQTVQKSLEEKEDSNYYLSNDVKQTIWEKVKTIESTKSTIKLKYL